MGLRSGVLVVVLSGCGATPTGVAELVITLNPTAFSRSDTPLDGVVHATDGKGLVGKGEVRFTVDVGSVSPGSATLDAYGSARFVWTCTTGCEAGGRVDASWANASGTVRASRTAAFEAGGGQGGGQGGGSVTTGVETGTSWRITGVAPAADWNTLASFDDTSWKAAPVIVPKGGSPAQIADSIWDLGPTTTSGSTQVWMRRTFTLSGALDSATLTFGCDDDMEAWLNGIKIITDTDGVATIRTIPDVRAQLVSGTNLVAVTCADRVPPEHGFWGALTIKTH
jgi:hypothetical protein